MEDQEERTHLGPHTSARLSATASARSPYHLSLAASRSQQSLPRTPSPPLPPPLPPLLPPPPPLLLLFVSVCERSRRMCPPAAPSQPVSSGAHHRPLPSIPPPPVLGAPVPRPSPQSPRRGGCYHKKPHFFGAFPRVRPEPVLVKISIKRRKRYTFSYLQSTLASKQKKRSAASALCCPFFQRDSITGITSWNSCRPSDSSSASSLTTSPCSASAAQPCGA